MGGFFDKIKGGMNLLKKENKLMVVHFSHCLLYYKSYSLLIISI